MAAPNARLSLNNPLAARQVSPPTQQGQPPGSGIFSKLKNLLPSSNTPGGNKMPMVLIIIGVVLLFIVVIIYIMFSLKSNKLQGKQLTAKPVKLDELAQALEILSAELPKPNIGREYSYSFWLYLDSYPQTYSKDGNGKMTPIDKLIFYRGAQGDVSTANPVVFMDGLSNKLYIAIKSQESTLTSVPNRVDYNGNLYNIRFMNYFMNSSLKIRDTLDPMQPAINKYLVLTVDYVPLQRWVNVTFIVDNKITTVFLDGEIYSVKSTEEFKAIREPERDVRNRPIDVNLIVDKTDGNVYIGKNSVGGKTTVPGYFSKLQFFNYAMSMSEVKAIYESGPIGANTFAGVKIPYGIRSPLYKLDDQVV